MKVMESDLADVDAVDGDCARFALNDAIEDLQNEIRQALDVVN